MTIICIYSFQRKKVIHLMRLANAFNAFPVTSQTEGFAMTRLLPKIKSLTKAALVALTVFHFSYCVLRFAINDRPFTFNTYYGPHGKESPYYELINLSQVCSRLFIGKTVKYHRIRNCTRIRV